MSKCNESIKQTMSATYLSEAPEVSMFESKGYLLIRVNEGLLALIDLVFSESRRFFRCEKGTKRRCSIPDMNEGWQDIGNEFSQDSTRPDLNESFWVTWKNRQRVLETYLEEGLSFYDIMTQCLFAYYEIEREITNALLRYYVSSEVDPEFNCRHDSDLLVIYYKPNQHTRQLLQESHEDGTYMTIVKPTRPGLELLLGDNNFHPARIERDQLLVMPGEIMSLLSGYQIKPLVHQVRRHQDQHERFSLCYFGHPDINPGQLISPWVQNKTNEGVDILQRSIRNKMKYFVM